MMRQSNYGKRMSDWEYKQELRRWEMRLQTALITLDMDSISDLVQEGIDNDYPIDHYKDNELFRYFFKRLR